ncbi:mechanosensitive ion channel family protein [Baaleninema sp.]|uniref:mechanosensitive ion channel family protein n=1 Tax=Baaleninema sp. TaxID=3101197 RepID=UPI003D076955
MSGQFFQLQFLGNTVLDYLIAVGIVVVGFIVVQIAKSLVLKSIKKWVHRTESDLDNSFIKILEQALVPVLYLGVFYLAIDGLILHQILDRAVDVVFTILFTIIVIRAIVALIEYALLLYGIKAKNPNIQPTLQSLLPAIRIVVWAIGLIFLLDNLQFNVSAIVASLGIGGIAVALAAQGVLQDLFSYFSILIDRPFELGDFIIVGDYMGTVEHVGIKTTRMKSLSGERLVLSNTDLTGSRIRNYKHMKTRRIVFSIGVTYETGLDKLEEIPNLLKAIVEATENVTFDRAHFASYGDFSLNYEVVYYVNSSDYAQYMDAQQQMNFEIKRAFDARNIDIAYPTQVIYYNPAAPVDGVTANAN